ncbi:hypothetical protein MMC11_008161 [Xylographa trunciseda]|nr:hypothetical protein [Xylographa trunciseda]
MASLSWSDLDDLDEEEFLGVVGSGMPVADVAPMATPSWSDLDDLEEEEFIDVLENGLVERPEAPIVPTENTYQRRYSDNVFYAVPGSNRLLGEVPLPNDGGRPHIIPSVKIPFRPRASPLSRVENVTYDEYVVEDETIFEELITLRQCAFRAARAALLSADAAADALACTADDTVEEAQVFTETDDGRYLESYDDDFEENNYVEEHAQRCYPGGLASPLKYLDMFDDLPVVNDDGRTHYHVLTPRTKPNSWSGPRASMLSTVEYAYPPTTTSLAIATVEHDREYTDYTATPVASEDDNSDDTSDSGYCSEEETTSLPPSAPAELTAIAENPALTVTPDHTCENPVYTETPVTGEEETVYTEILVVEEEVASFGHHFLGKSIVVLRSLQAVIDATLDLVR